MKYIPYLQKYRPHLKVSLKYSVFQIAKLLLQQGVDVTLRNKENKTAIELSLSKDLTSLIISGTHSVYRELQLEVRTFLMSNICTFMGRPMEKSKVATYH